MCGRYILVQKISVIEKRFNLKPTVDIEFEPDYNIGPGSFAPVITDDKPKELQLFQFGLTPFWAKKKMYLFNARAEGDGNKENNPDYKGAKGIITKPAFRKPIRSQRCLVIADAFYEGPMKEKLDKPYLVYLQEKNRPFAFAGIWDKWIDEEGSEINSYAIITTTANELLQKIGHERSPVILSRRNEALWLRGIAPLADITSILAPYPTELMNAYPVAPKVKNPRANGKELIAPIGQRIYKEYNLEVETTVNLQGMGSGKIKAIEKMYDENKNDNQNNTDPELSK